MEYYRGMVVFATNKKDDLDPVFTRRIQYFVEFSAPGGKKACRAGHFLTSELFIWHPGPAFDIELSGTIDFL
jgi:SpoVK/Ycf46/Vps4 family AAA+-type ATPase